MISCSWARSWNFVSFEKNALRDTRVFDFRLAYVDWVVFQMIIKYTLSNSEVFIFVFNNWFLKVAEETKHLSIELQPLWRNSWDWVIFSELSWSNTLQLQRLSFSHRLQKVFINFFLNSLSFLQTSAILDPKLLCFVIASDLRILRCISW